MGVVGCKAPGGGDDGAEGAGAARAGMCVRMAEEVVYRPRNRRWKWRNRFAMEGCGGAVA